MSSDSFTFRVGGPEPHDPASIYNQAQAFYLAGSRCALNIEVGPDLTQCLVSPAVVNFCFATELFFKAMLESVGTNVPRTHRLDELFRLLEQADKTAVEANYREKFVDPTLEVLLDACTDYFQRVRYDFEYEIFSYQDAPIATLARAAYLQASRLRGITVGIDRLRL